MTGPKVSSIKRGTLPLGTCARCRHELVKGEKVTMHCAECTWWRCPSCQWVNGPQGAIRGGAS